MAGGVGAGVDRLCTGRGENVEIVFDCFSTRLLSPTNACRRISNVGFSLVWWMLWQLDPY